MKYLLLLICVLLGGCLGALFGPEGQAVADAAPSFLGMLFGPFGAAGGSIGLAIYTAIRGHLTHRNKVKFVKDLASNTYEGIDNLDDKNKQALDSYLEQKVPKKYRKHYRKAKALKEQNV